jgi:hypothetical protein
VISLAQRRKTKAYLGCYMLKKPSTHFCVDIVV